jgi:predicted small metal-binding protein
LGHLRLFEGPTKAFAHLPEHWYDPIISIRLSGGAKAMAEQMKQIECPAPCNFSLKSHDEKEIVEITIQHAKKKHDMTIAEQDVKEMIKPA